MGKRWLKERKRDYYYRRAKKEHYRSRAAYKLLQLNRRFGILRPGYRVIELGCAPGGWTQVAAEAVGDSGLVVGVDLQAVEPLEYENVVLLRGDFRSTEVRERLRELIPECDALISDASPDISGIWDVDHARSIELCELALEIAEEHLVPGGNLLLKVFQGELLQSLVERVRGCFGYVKLTKPRASRSESAEVYLIGRGFSRLRRGEVYRVKIAGESRRGDGIARIKGTRVFVRGARRGDEVRVRITHLRQGFAEGEVC
ncbi:MAG: TRAM domain-containing protein [Euryarchaeota archaeon]|nr:TRAM domain-containing protein [Euryarchaeota archaeon]